LRRLLPVLVGIAALWLAPGALASGWCGSGETSADRPDAVTGQQIHAIYADPSDGPDTFATGATQLADDVASISSWWTGQDPTRVPRFDQASFDGQTCLDISYIRLQQTGALFASGGASGAFGALEQDLLQDGIGDPYKKYLVYYGGPPVENGICGTGAGDFADGPSLAAVWLNGCVGYPTDAIGAHELLHTLGALPLGAPNACTPQTDPAGVSDPGHPCDSPSDVLYPYSSGAPLTSLVLDYNHDDYYAHSGSWDDIQDSDWLRHLEAPQFALAVTIAGGAGQVESDLPGIDCTVSCTTQWDSGSNVTLTATPAAGERFVGWSGGTCISTGDCTVEVGAAKTVVAVFGPARVAFHAKVTGKGRVACRPACHATEAAGQSLALTAVPATGWKFVRWAGSCAGKRTICGLSTNKAISVTAVFAKKAVKPKSKVKPKKR
jgi:hypothetical protein